MSRRAKAVAWCVALLLVVAIAAAQFGDYFAEASVSAREYRHRLSNVLKANAANFSDAFPGEVVCFVPEGRFAPFYVESKLRSEVVYSEGDESEGHWFVLIKNIAQNKTWIFMLRKDEIDCAGQEYVCPQSIKMVTKNGQTLILVR